MTERTDAYMMEVERDMPDGFVYKRLHWFFKNKKELLLNLADSSADDETIRAFISDVFGIYGGGSMDDPKGWYEYSGGKDPRLTFQNSDFVITEELKGRRLLEAFRTIYKIRRGGQLSLF